MIICYLSGFFLVDVSNRVQGSGLLQFLLRITWSKYKILGINVFVATVVYVVRCVSTDACEAKGRTWVSSSLFSILFQTGFSLHMELTN